MTDAKYHVLWDNGNACDGLNKTFSSIEDAIPWVMEIYEGWVDGGISGSFDKDKWNEMIETCYAWVAKYNEEKEEYEDAWFLPDDMAKEIGWVRWK